ncbi:hypothetical protein [Paraglaciecola sp.]|uniref:hypothetical protein n=1 Tax=Paraglaciecola sp. TaxID=1920173 RepID=UPI003F4AA474
MGVSATPETDIVALCTKPLSEVTEGLIPIEYILDVDGSRVYVLLLPAVKAFKSNMGFAKITFSLALSSLLLL